MVARTIVLGPELDWLPDDTEESLVGTILHQQVIVSTVNSVTRIIRQRNLGWVIGNQLMLVVPREGGGRPYQPSPDILIHTATSFPIDQPSLRVAHYGPPALAIEICSPIHPAGGCPAAYQHDLDTVDPDAKPQADARIGIQEYLVYDPTDTIIRDEPGIRAWQMGPHGSYIPWLSEPDGRWHSRLGISFGVEGVLLRVYDPEGRVVPNNEDMDTIAEAQEALITEQAARIAELEAELQRRRGE
jgi:Uma2 family endonuclease